MNPGSKMLLNLETLDSKQTASTQDKTNSKRCREMTSYDYAKFATNHLIMPGKPLLVWEVFNSSSQMDRDLVRIITNMWKTVCTQIFLKIFSHF